MLYYITIGMRCASLEYTISDLIFPINLRVKSLKQEFLSDYMYESELLSINELNKQLKQSILMETLTHIIIKETRLLQFHLTNTACKQTFNNLYVNSRSIRWSNFRHAVYLIATRRTSVKFDHRTLKCRIFFLFFTLSVIRVSQFTIRSTMTS